MDRRQDVKCDKFEGAMLPPGNQQHQRIKARPFLLKLEHLVAALPEDDRHDDPLSIDRFARTMVLQCCSPSTGSQVLLQAQLQLWHQSLGFFKSAALAIAIDLHTPDAIHRLGGAATLPQILVEAGISPCRLRDLRRVPVHPQGLNEFTFSSFSSSMEQF
ncbi:hypothetical protein HU200_034939 [Digitaria exilis]|uniref:O-methyltransferase dimerisation domain-containing protein n=1 Tax=Digitaria exilis TaxID=1010633 RepID=A0A835ELJ1_9POAL|nr:hypothetical protein HU200_034939 [Digitaria exilis]